MIDAAGSYDSHLLPTWYGKGSALSEDALTVERWDSPAFCNPPYDGGIARWLEKFLEQARLEKTVVALLPAKVGTKWWAKGVVPCCDIIFLTGRVPFERDCPFCKGTKIWGDSVQPGTYIVTAGGTTHPDPDDPCPRCLGIGILPSSPNHDSAVVIYSPNVSGRVRWWDWRSHIADKTPDV